VSVARTVRELMSSGRLDLPDPGCGATAARHLTLFDIARTSPVSVARIVEAHTDALSILHEAGSEPHAGACYGVWASAAPGQGARLRGTGHDLQIDGVKPFASGLGIVDRALVTVDDERQAGDVGGGVGLVDTVVAEGPTIKHDTTGWTTAALADSATGSARFEAHPVTPADLVGSDGWYLERPGFWHGACGPAACWAGAAAGLVDAAGVAVDGDPHRRAHLGAMRSARWLLQAALAAAGDEIDREPTDVLAARARAIALRHAVERTVADILDRFGQALGPRPFVGDAAANQRWIDTHLYTRQHHAERDLVVLGRDGDT
jgi:hypothetical protein